MAAAPRSAWGRGGVSPSLPKPEARTGPPDDEGASPFTVEDKNVVWFLGDVVTHPTHYLKGKGTVPCRPDDAGTCPHCSSGDPGYVSAWAPVLLQFGSLNATTVWKPRTMRVPKHWIDHFGTNLRGKSYLVQAHNRGQGNKKKFDFKPQRKKDPPIETFDVAQVLENIWNPRKAVQVVVPSRVLVTDDTVLSPDGKTKTRAEELAELNDADLVVYFKRMQGGPVKAWFDEAQAEIDRRGIIVDKIDPDHPPDKDSTYLIGAYATKKAPPAAAERKRGCRVNELDNTMRLMPYEDFLDFVAAVRRMRDSQREYFRLRREQSHMALEPLFKLIRVQEAEVDRRVRETSASARNLVASLFAEGV